MRLLCAKDLSFHELEDDIVPPYAVLSHTWSRNEVSFEEMKNGRGKDKEGFAKILKCAEKTLEFGLDYFWIDTCCVDKRSSAELSEAINSMYKWYREAVICFAHLSGVSKNDPPHREYPTVTSLETCRWFRRGWTIQELLAPSEVIFFSEEWESVGKKSVLTKHISAITNIQEAVLACLGLPSETTRPEDVAYCLMGIFGVNMPLLYGEGDKAFLRLQEEIIKTSEDHSIFAWADELTSPCLYSGLLAQSPAHFANAGHLNFYHRGDLDPFSMTNRGLKIQLQMNPVKSPRSKHIGDATLWHAFLNCYGSSTAPTNTPSIYLVRAKELSWHKDD
ncbi:HET-domain-containing protein [Rhizodiscina lignyota]|uniref:HET-domain-containing protein n=1 Tax=Rhizodiscina lignyota TaxID=1504668 RepID=A0A9P4M1D4_9PEZI|nr:HET-domain-containing protein [Rhizodiscina lignyota]